MPQKKDKKKDKKNKIDNTTAILALILNIIILPGVGSIVGGRVKEGIWQMILWLGGIFLGVMFIASVIGIFIGIPILILAPLAGWIWALVTGIDLVKQTQK